MGGRVLAPSGYQIAVVSGPCTLLLFSAAHICNHSGWLIVFLVLLSVLKSDRHLLGQGVLVVYGHTRTWVSTVSIKCVQIATIDLVGGGGGGGKQLSFSALTQHQIPGGSPYTQACSHNHWYSEMTV